MADRTAISQLPDGDVKHLRGPERLWRLRVGVWRVLLDRRASEEVIDVRRFDLEAAYR